MLKNRKENLNMSKKCLKVLSTHVFSVTSFEKALLEIHHYLHLNISSTQWNCLFSFGIGRGWILSRINKVYEIFSHSNKRVSPQLIGVLKLLSSLSSTLFPGLPDESLLYLWSALFSCGHFSYYMICVEPYTPGSSVSWKSDIKDFLVVADKVHF